MMRLLSRLKGWSALKVTVLAGCGGLVSGNSAEIANYWYLPSTKRRSEGDAALELVRGRSPFAHVFVWKRFASAAGDIEGTICLPSAVAWYAEYVPALLELAGDAGVLIGDISVRMAQWLRPVLRFGTWAGVENGAPVPGDDALDRMARRLILSEFGGPPTVVEQFEKTSGGRMSARANKTSEMLPLRLAGGPAVGWRSLAGDFEACEMQQSRLLWPRRLMWEDRVPALVPVRVARGLQVLGILSDWETRYKVAVAGLNDALSTAWAVSNGGAVRYDSALAILRLYVAGMQEVQRDSTGQVSETCGSRIVEVGGRPAVVGKDSSTPVQDAELLAANMSAVGMGTALAATVEGLPLENVNVAGWKVEEAPLHDRCSQLVRNASWVWQGDAATVRTLTTRIAMVDRQYKQLVMALGALERIAQFSVDLPSHGRRLCELMVKIGMLRLG